MLEFPDAVYAGREMEGRGRYDEAARSFLRSAGTRLGEYLHEPAADKSNIALAVPELVRAIYCARRANDRPLATAYGEFFSGLLAVLLEAGGNRDIEAIAAELRGDVDLLLESQGARDAYGEAMENYSGLDVGTQASIALEPEVERAHDVIREYLEWEGIEFPRETPNGEPTVVDLAGRTRLKRELAPKIVTAPSES